jgi:uncharacterized membrane protein YfcA
MIFDFHSLAFFLISFVGGMIAIPIGGSFLLIIPMFLLLGLNGLQTLLLSRIFATSSMVSASSYFFFHHKFEWKKILYFLSGNIVGYFLAAKLATSINITTLTKIIPWILLLGGILLLKDWKIEKLRHQKIFAKLLPLFGLLCGFYGGMGGAGMGPTIVLLLALAFSWNIHKSIVNARMIELFGNAIVVVAYLYFGAKFTNYEIPTILGGLLGGFLGAKITLKSKPTWLKKAFLILVLISAIKTTFF